MGSAIIGSSMRIDTDVVFAEIESLVHAPLSVSAKLSRVIDACEAGFPHDGWQALRAVQYDDDVSRLRSWIPQLLQDEPPPFSIRGVWIGIANYVSDGRETADMHFVGSESYDPQDTDQHWAVYAGYRPERGEAQSAVLDTIYDIAYRRYPELNNDAEWSLCLAYAAFSIAEILRNATPKSFGSDDEVGVVVGFDEGDSVTVGRVTAEGLQASRLIGS